MRKSKRFKEISDERKLIKFSWSEFGTLYFDPKASRKDGIMVRHLDGKLSADFLTIYESFYNAILKCVADTPKLRRYVYLSSLLEVGIDYYINHFYVYEITIEDYLLEEGDEYYDEYYVEPPELFGEMQREVSKILTNDDGREGIIKKVLRKSLLEPTGKTFFGYRENKFIIVEPKISIDDLKKWKEFCEDSHND